MNPTRSELLTRLLSANASDIAATESSLRHQRQDIERQSDSSAYIEAASVRLSVLEHELQARLGERLQLLQQVEAIDQAQ
jgi:hypothetical protein